MNAKKSQAATELIVTYGWIIAVVLLALAALSYFGVLNPHKAAPSRCVVLSTSDAFSCVTTSSFLTKQGIRIALINGNDYTINFTNFSYSLDSKNFIPCANSPNLIIGPHEANFLLCNFSNPLVEDHKKIWIRLTYIGMDDLLHTFDIEYYGKVTS